MGGAGILWCPREILAANVSVRFSVVVAPGARRTRVERIDATSLRVSVSAPAREGRANAAVVKAVAEFLHVAPSRVRIIRGAASRRKVLEITEGPSRCQS
ncbi:MAG: DUF167 domain-containing protein [Armatimonadota bacterium]